MAEAQNSNINDIAGPEDPMQYDFGRRYEVLATLGQGGMGTVLKAQHRQLKKLVAIKVLHATMIVDETNRQRFEIEAQAGSKLQHPNLISVFDYGFIKAGTPYLVMEYVEGVSLDQFIDDNGGRLNPDQFIDIFKQVNKALSYIHKSGIVHRDLKTTNIMIQMIDGERYVKLLDFGIAKFLGEDGMAQQQLTKTGTVFGSPPYMSPEQCMGRKIDTRSDIYSLGCVMYECISGLPPLLGDNALQTIFKHANERAEPLQLGPSKEETQIADAIHKCLENEPDKRFQTAGDLLAALSAIAPTGEISVATSGLKPNEKEELSALWNKVPDARPTNEMLFNSNPNIGSIDRHNHTSPEITQTGANRTGTDFTQQTGQHNQASTGSYTKKLREEMNDQETSRGINVKMILAGVGAVVVLGTAVYFGAGLLKTGSTASSGNDPLTAGQNSFRLGKEHFEEARNQFKEALNKSPNDDEVVGVVYSRLGRMLLVEEKFAGAKDYLKESVDHLSKSRDQHKDEYLDAIVGLGEIRYSQKNYEKAGERFDEARKLAEEWKVEPQRLGDIIVLSAKSARNNNPEEATYLYTQAVEQFEKASPTPYDKITDAYVESAQLRMKMNDLTDARNRLEKAQTACSKITSDYVKTEMERRVSELALQTKPSQGQAEAAADLSATLPASSKQNDDAAAKLNLPTIPELTGPSEEAKLRAQTEASKTELAKAELKMVQERMKAAQQLSQFSNERFQAVQQQLKTLNSAQTSGGNSYGGNYSTPTYNTNAQVAPSTGGKVYRDYYDVGKDFK